MQGLLALMSLAFKETLNTNLRLFKSACKLMKVKYWVQKGDRESPLNVLRRVL